MRKPVNHLLPLVPESETSSETKLTVFLSTFEPLEQWHREEIAFLFLETTVDNINLIVRYCQDRIRDRSRERRAETSLEFRGRIEGLLRRRESSINSRKSLSQVSSSFSLSCFAPQFLVPSSIRYFFIRFLIISREMQFLWWNEIHSCGCESSCFS